MENELKSNNPVEGNQINLSKKAAAYLMESGKWGSFLAWLIIILVAIFLVSFISMFFVSTGYSQAFNSQTEFKVLMFIAYLIMAAIYFFPIYYLFNFSKFAKIAITQNNSELLESSIKNLKSLFKFYGIFSIIYLVLMLFVGLGSLLATSLF